MTEEQRIKQAVAALDVVLQTIERLRDQVNTIRQKLEEQNPVKDALTHFDQHWIAAYTRGASPVQHYQFNGLKDATAVKRLLKTMDATTLLARITNYFRDRDDFLVRQRHPFGLFIARVNAYASTAAQPDAAAPPDCTHVPRCISDTMHTRRRANDLRNEQ